MGPARCGRHRNVPHSRNWIGVAEWQYSNRLPDRPACGGRTRPSAAAGGPKAAAVLPVSRSQPAAETHGIHTHPRRPHAQPAQRQPRPAAAPAGRRHGAVGIGQELARLRHAVRGRAAPLRRVAVGVRAAVPAADGEARRRPDRGPLAGDLDRAEGNLAQPALDGGHGDRDPRLPAPALRAGRRPALPGPPFAEARGDDDLADGRCDARAARGHQAHDPRPGGGQPQGRAGRALHRTPRQGLRPRPRRRQGLRDRRGAEARQERQAHDRGRRRPAEGPARAQAAPGRVVRDGAAHRRRPRDRRRDGHRARAPVLGQVRLPGLQLLAGGARAAPVLVQQPDGCLPEVRRPGHDQLLRPQAHRRGFRSSRSPRGPSRAGTGATSSTSRCCRGSPSTAASTSSGRSRS